MQAGVLLSITVGGALGSLARYFLSTGIYRLTGTNFPWGIFAVNVLGGLVMGMVVELGALKLNYSPEMRAFLITGILGGFTTFSAFSLDAALLIERGDLISAGLYVVGSVVFSIGALFGAMWVLRGLL
jgi:CrcB protein